MSLEFDLIVLLIMASFVIIGYITGATYEFIKLIKVLVPFLIVFYFGGDLSRFVYHSTPFNYVVDKLTFLEGIVYFNSVVMLLSTLLAFTISYSIISLFIHFLQKRIQTDVITFKLGKLNSTLGSILSLLRFYLVISIIILPFYILSITTKNEDFTTKMIMNHPPAFTRVGHMINRTEPMIEASQSVKYLLDFTNLNRMQSYKDFILNYTTQIDTYRSDVFQLYIDSGASHIFVFNDSKTVLDMFLQKPTLFIEASSDEYRQAFMDKNNELSSSKGLLLWANQLETNDEQVVIEQFNANYEVILKQTSDKQIKEQLTKAYDYSLLYYIVKDWLVSIGINIESNLNSDEQVKLILESLVSEFEQKNTSTLINEVYLLNKEQLTHMLNSIETYVKKYDTDYRKLILEMEVDLPFQYKLIAATLKDFDFNSTFKRSPLISFYTIDNLTILSKENYQIIDEESVYETVVKIIVPLYILDEEPFTPDDMEDVIQEIQKGYKDLYLTQVFVLQLIDAFLSGQITVHGEDIVYSAYLLKQNKLTISSLETLLNSDLLVIGKSDSKEIKELKLNIKSKLHVIIESGDLFGNK